MNESKLVTPILEEYIIGECMSEHHGVYCFPAIKQDTQQQYILKVLTFPASPVQLDAMLLTGAYPSREAAMEYFKEQAQCALKEAEHLQELARLEGFAAFEASDLQCQEDACRVYLLSPYKTTVQQYMRQNPMTHLGAVNLGLDLCAALSVCRKNGHLFINLKPENVFMSDEGTYFIGDLGFMELAALKYASVPERCLSAYTAPEVTDAYATLNTTLDTYAVGLILYQAYNNGELPAADDGEAPLPPAYADYEMAEIILKACAPEPADRWEDPEQMGQALVSYMQRNSVNDVPIMPPVIPDVPEPASEEESPAQYEEEDQTELLAEELPFSDETVPTEETGENLDGAALTEEVSSMLAQADELIAQSVPEPVIAPEPVDIPIPEPVVPEEAAEEADAEQTEVDDGGSVAVAEEENEDLPDEEPQKPSFDYAPMPQKKPIGIVVGLACVLLLLALAIGGFHFYENIYLQPMGMSWVGNNDCLTVTLNTNLDGSSLTVYCTDTYGNKLSQQPQNGTVVFTELKPGSHYRIYAEVRGFHRLIGTTEFDYTTSSQTTIASFTAVTGDKDGSVNLTFSVQGPENTTWSVYYNAPGGMEQSTPCTGHMATVTGLNPGTTYTFRLVPDANLYVVGSDTLEYTASKLIMPENLAIEGFHNGALVASWDVPEGASVASWTVRCYNSNGYDQTFTVTEPTVSIEELAHDQPYTLEVKAAGMSVFGRVSVSANSVTFRELLLDDVSLPGQLIITWNYEGTAPETPWHLFYTIDGGDPHIIESAANTCTIEPILPGAHYSISFELPEDITVFGGTKEYNAPEAENFNAYGVTAENLYFRMLPTPTNTNWKWSYLSENDFRSEFAVGEKASFVMIMDKKPQNTDEEISTLWVIRDANGKLVSINAGRTRTWGYMWSYYASAKGNYGTELDVPSLPPVPGTYTVELYFNGAYVTTQTFTVK